MATVTREQRIREYAKPAREENWNGASRDMKDIDRWSERAHRESDGHRHRAKAGEMSLPSTGEMELHSTATGAPADRRAVAKKDLNHDIEGSAYMKGVRRTA
jgi:hypothetical protein